MHLPNIPMASIMQLMNQSPQLYQIQQMDSELNQVKKRLAAIQHEIETDDTLRVAEERVKSAQQKLLKAQRDLQTLEENAKSIQIKISTSEASLYGGKIHNPKELQDLQNEIAAHKRRLSALEDEQLEGMLAVEVAEKEFKQAQTLSVQAQSTFATQKAALMGEQGQLQKVKERLQTERNAAAGSILPENLKIYERLLVQKRGLAVTAIDDEACVACGSPVRPAERQAARSAQQLVFCSSCGRILFAD